MMGFKELAKTRQSCRNYDKSKPVEREVLEDILRTAMNAPSACNSQPWGISVVIDKETAEEVGKCCRQFNANKFTEEVNAFIVINEERACLLERVAKIVKNQEFASIDIGLMTAHIILSAEEKGLGTCIMGIFDEKKLKSLLSIDESKRIRLVLAVGYPKAEDEIREKKRKDFDKVVRFI